MDVRVATEFDTSQCPPPHGGQRILHAGAAVADAKIVMILLHGRGAGPHDIISVAEAYDLPGVCYLAPGAADDSWYPQLFTSPLEANAAAVESAHALIEALLGLLAEEGFPPERCVLGGFSQGACLASDHAFRYPRRYGLIVGYSGGLIGGLDHAFEPQGDLEGTPVELSCGDADPFIPWPRVEQTAEVLTAMSAEVELEKYPGLPHSISRTQVDKTTVRLQALIDGAN
ncbi:MAG: dienelactone hydrolase family protein [Phycisphaera sp.]|nr:MAG: dienelactone hydrolase family protein [Phycisphaera sp.]